jgi:hypothetical protein
MQLTALYDLHIESYLMQRTSFRAMACPVALSLERVGEGRSIMILRDAFLGLTRFDQFRKVREAPGAAEIRRSLT